MLGLKLGLSCVPQAGGGGEETPEWLEDFRAPSGDLPGATADFIGENYAEGTTEVAASAIIDRTDLIGVNGLVNPDQAQLINFAGAMLTTVLTMNWTIVFECVFDDGGMICFISDGGDREFVVNAVGQGDIVRATDGDGAESRQSDSLGFITEGVVQRVAVTRTASTLSISLNGEAAVTDTTTTPNMTGVNVARLLVGADVEAIRSVAIYPPQSDADLDELARPAGAPHNTVAPVISGTPAIDQTLSATDGTWVGDEPITFTYQWLSNGVVISGATEDEYVINGEHESAMITCRVTGTNAIAVSALSNALGPVVP